VTYATQMAPSPPFVMDMYSAAMFPMVLFGVTSTVNEVPLGWFFELPGVASIALPIWSHRATPGVLPPRLLETSVLNPRPMFTAVI
jgi:hypothetical protein